MSVTLPAPLGAPAATRRPRLRVVAGTPVVRRWGARSAALTAAVTLLASVALHALIAQDQLRLDRLRATAAREQRSYELLRLQVAEEEAPATIVARAAELGLVPSAPRPVGVPSTGGTEARPLGAEDPTPATRAGAWQRMKRHLAVAP